MPAGDAPTIPGFAIRERIAAGRHATVWRAKTADGAAVALKVVPETRVTDADRFLREATVLAGIDHPHIIRCRGSGRTGSDLWLAMDLAAGDVAGLIRRGRPEPQRALEIIRDAARGAAEIARRGLVHRDLSPANLLLMGDGRCVLGDFGLVLADLQRLTSDGGILGTPAYLAPEQARGGTPDARADIYGLGACLFALATGRAPYRGDSAWAVVQQAAIGPFPDPRIVAPGIRPEIRSMIRAATALMPEERYASADDLRIDAEAVLGGGVPTLAGQVRARRADRDSLDIVASRPAMTRPSWFDPAVAGAAGLAAGLILGLALTRDDATERADFARAGATATADGWRTYQQRHPDGAGSAAAQAALRVLSQPAVRVDATQRDHLAGEIALLRAEIARLRGTP